MTKLASDNLEISNAIIKYLNKIGNKSMVDNDVTLAGQQLQETLNHISSVEEDLDYTSCKFLTPKGYPLRVEAIKIASITSLLPAPEPTDSKLYSFIYDTFSAFQERHLLALRFGLRGRTTINEMEMILQFSCREFIIHSMQDSFGNFLEHWSDYLSGNDFQMSDIDLQSILKEVHNNILCADPDIEEIATQLSQGKSFSLLYETNFPKHWTSIVASKEMVIFADRWSNSIQTSKGIDICEHSSQDDVIPQLKQFHNESFQSAISTDEKDMRIKDNHPLISHIPLSLQKSDNCGWSSGAKTIIYSNMILASYQHFHKHLSHDDSLLKAQEMAKKLYHYWAHDFDRVNALKKAIAKPEKQIDLLLIACILLQSEHKTAPYRKKITQLIKDKNIITVEIREAAEKLLLGNIQTTLKNDRTSVNSGAHKYLSLYLGKGGTKEADAFIKEEDEKYTQFITLCRKHKLMNLARKKVITFSDFSTLKEASERNLITEFTNSVLERKMVQDELEFGFIRLDSIFNAPQQQLKNLIHIFNAFEQDETLKSSFESASIDTATLLELKISPAALEEIKLNLKSEPNFLRNQNAVASLAQAYHDKLDPQIEASSSKRHSVKKR